MGRGLQEECSLGARKPEFVLPQAQQKQGNPGAGPGLRAVKMKAGVKPPPTPPPCLPRLLGLCSKPTQGTTSPTPVHFVIQAKYLFLPCNSQRF